MAAEPTFPVLLKSQRLELCSYREEDTGDLSQLIESNREQLLRNFLDVAKASAAAPDMRSFIQDCTKQWEARKVFHYGIWTRQPSALIGQLKVKNVLWDVPSAELSYFIGSTYLRKGYATEAILAVLRTAFEQLMFNRVYVRIIASNVGSLELIRKLGMRHEGLHRREFRCGYGELHDVEYFSVTRDDYPGIGERFGPRG